MKPNTSIHLACLVSLVGSVLAGEIRIPDAVVAADGSGDFQTVQEAVNKASQYASAGHPWRILVKPGIYKERVYVQREKHHVELIGKDAATTVITYNLYTGMKGPDGLEIGTFRTPTVIIDADNFTMENITLENSAGPVGQALALRVDGDEVTFRHCNFKGFQDTILLNRGRQYFMDCTITGAVDFIFGGATAWFDKCEIVCVRDGYITAASTPAEARYGFVFSNCTIAIPDPKTKVYLGRPWRPFASTIFLNTNMDAGVQPVGWHNWGQPDREKTARYAESNSSGPGANPAKRVSWAGTPSQAEADKISLAEVLGDWKP